MTKGEMQPGWLRRINWWRPSPRLASIYRAERSLGFTVQPIRSDIDVWGEEIDATLGSHRSRRVNTSTRPINLWIEPKINVWIFAQCQPRIDFKSNWCSMVQFWFWVTSSFQRGVLLCFRLFYVERLTDMNGARVLCACFQTFLRLQWNDNARYRVFA